MHELYELKEKLIKELEDYAQNGKFSKEEIVPVVKAGDALICKHSDKEVTLLENGHVKTDKGEMSMLAWLKDVTGWPTVHTYKIAIHKETGKTLSELRKEYMQENLEEE